MNYLNQKFLQKQSLSNSKGIVVILVFAILGMLLTSCVSEAEKERSRYESSAVVSLKEITKMIIAGIYDPENEGNRIAFLDSFNKTKDLFYKDFKIMIEKDAKDSVDIYFVVISPGYNEMYGDDDDICFTRSFDILRGGKCHKLIEEKKCILTSDYLIYIQTKNMPQDQKNFIMMVEDYKEKYENTSNTAKKKIIYEEFYKKIESFKNKAVFNWVGKMEYIGNTVFMGVTLPDSYALRVSMGYISLVHLDIKHKDEVFKKMAELKNGSPVLFSGQFSSWGIVKTGKGETETILNPTFEVKFKNIKNIGAHNSENPSEIIKLSFHVMSKCAYGAQVISGVKPALDKLGKAVDFEINYIGNEKDGQWMPMHGEQELKGDKIAVCAKKYMPEKYMDLIFCMSNDKEFRKVPDNFDACITETKLNGDKVKACAEGQEGVTLVVESYKASQAKGVSGSPTIYINDEPYQGGRRSDDFLRAICEKFTTETPKACSEIPEPVVVKMTIITDKRCSECKAENFANNLKNIFPGLEVEILDYADEKGKAEYQKYAAKGFSLLPIIIFDTEAKDDEGYAKIQKWIQEADDKLILNVGAKFDPTKEICDNKVDDTGNGKIDCDDDDCKAELVCRAEIKKKLDVFVMSQCPYGVMALDAMEEVLQLFKEDKIDFNINYIATETEPGKFQALHGQPEVDENIRELCAIKNYPKSYMDYIWCRNKNIRSDEWKKCAKGAIKADVIEKCFTGREGVKLHSENIKIANSMGIGGSPTWIINNKHQASGNSAADIQRNLCTHNPDLKGCRKPLKQ